MRTIFGADFDVTDGYLNTPSIGVPPVHVGEVVAASVDRWRRGADAPPLFDEMVETAREAFARLVGTDARNVAAGATASQLVGLVAAGFPRGSKVLVAENDFTSVTWPFAARGHEVTEVPLEKLAEHVEGQDLVAVSVVQSKDGAIVDLAALRAAAESAGVPVLLDATQSLGWFPADLAWADWVVAAGYKWLMCPRGASWLAVRPEALERTIPIGANWYAGEDRWNNVYGLPLRLAEGARGLDLSPIWLAQAAAAVALPYVASLDQDAVRKHCVGLADSVLRALGQPEQGSAIISVEADGDRLAGAGVVSSRRAGRTRMGFHLYNTERDAELVIEALGPFG